MVIFGGYAKTPNIAQRMIISQRHVQITKGIITRAAATCLLAWKSRQRAAIMTMSTMI